MKKLVRLVCVCSLFIILLGCDENKVVEVIRYSINEPVFMPSGEFRNSVKVTDEAIPITKRGKICFYQDYLYVSSPRKGIHIVDNRDPASPHIVGFIELIGNADLSIRDDKLYADSYVDLVWFDLANPAHPELKGRLEGAFHHSLPMIENGHGFDYNMCFSEEAKAKGIVVGWTVKEREERFEYDPDNYLMNDMASATNGVNGSMSRFSIYDTYLYTVINNQMSVFDISGETPVVAANNIYVGWNVETIFNSGDKMFMGTPTGMIIYSLENPLEPRRRSSITHVFGCDPVVVEGDLAYVTVHSGNNCGQNNNELLIVDVSDVDHPSMIASYAMKSPKGLGIDNETLFLCDDGLKVYNAKDPLTLMRNQLVHYAGMDGYDVIPYENTLMMIADDGLYQYDYSNIQEITQLGKLPMGK